MEPDKPLHVQVAEVLGWSEAAPYAIGSEAGSWGWHGVRPSPCEPCGDLGRRTIPRYDTDWSATGPELARLKAEGWNVVLQCENGGEWFAHYGDIGQNRPHVSLHA